MPCLFIFCILIKGENDMDIGMFIKKCFEIGISLLNKEKLTEEEKEFLNTLDSFEKWIQDVNLCSREIGRH